MIYLVTNKDVVLGPYAKDEIYQGALQRGKLFLHKAHHATDVYAVSATSEIDAIKRKRRYKK